MATRKSIDKPHESTSLTIAIVGEGVTPRHVGLRQLAALLEATATTFEAIAQERGVDPPQLSLTAVKNGSAAYRIVSDTPQAPRAIHHFVRTIRQCGKNASPRTRQSLARLHGVATKVGAGLRVVPSDAPRESEPIMLAPPLPEDDAKIEEGTVVFARVVGVRLDVRDCATITLRYDDSGSGEFQADSELTEKAARLLGRHVEARVTFLRGEGRNFDGEVEEIHERQPSNDLMAAIIGIRSDLDEHGIVLDATAWLAEEREDE